MKNFAWQWTVSRDEDEISLWNFLKAKGNIKSTIMQLLYARYLPKIFAESGKSDDEIRAACLRSIAEFRGAIEEIERIYKAHRG